MRTRGKVLVIDDNTGVGESIRTILKPHFEVFTAASGARALNILRTHDIDTVTLEPWLPGIQGRELLNRIRAADQRVRVILVTGHPLSLWFDDGVREEVFDYLPKPFDAKDVLQAVRRSSVRSPRLTPPGRPRAALAPFAERPALRPVG